MNFIIITDFLGKEAAKAELFKHLVQCQCVARSSTCVLGAACSNKGKLDGSNFAYWKPNFKVWLIEKGLWELILGPQRDPESLGRMLFEEISLALQTSLASRRRSRWLCRPPESSSWQLCKASRRRSRWLCRPSRACMKCAPNWLIFRSRNPQCDLLITEELSIQAF